MMMIKQSLPLLFLLYVSTLKAAGPGELPPECAALTIENQKLNISSYRNKVVYLDFWASWCPPCKQSFPILDKLHSELKDKGLEVIAINVDEDRNDALEFLEGSPVKFPIFYDGEGNCPSLYDVKAMPSSYIIDKHGVIKKVFLGFHEENETEIRSDILTLISE
ncbi:MAG: TlpA disulfide reductase family protein [Gammaproteobacteria bacterium]